MLYANFNSYNNYVTDSLYQWDKNQDLIINGLGLSVAPEIHFTNATMDKAIVRTSTVEDGVITVRIPNSLLQQAITIKAYVGLYEGETFKVIETIEIPVIAKARPFDYTIADDEEVYSFKHLENKISNIIANNNDTEGNSELVDIRLGADGVLYDTAGDAVRGQIRNLSDAINEKTEDINSDLSDIRSDMETVEKDVETALKKIIITDDMVDSMTEKINIALSEDIKEVHTNAEVYSVNILTPPGVAEGWNCIINTVYMDEGTANVNVKDSDTSETIAVMDTENDDSLYLGGIYRLLKTRDGWIITRVDNIEERLSVVEDNLASGVAVEDVNAKIDSFTNVETVVNPGVEASANLLNPANVVTGTRVQMIDRTTHFEWYLSQVATFSHIIIPIVAGHKYKMLFTTGISNSNLIFFWASGTEANLDTLTPISKSTGKYATADETVYAEAPDGATYLVYSGSNLNLMVYDYTEHGLLTEWIDYQEAIPETTEEIITIKERALPNLGLDEIREDIKDFAVKTEKVGAMDLKDSITKYLGVEDIDVVSGCSVVNGEIVTNEGSLYLRIELNNITPTHAVNLLKGKYYLHFDLERPDDNTVVFVRSIRMISDISDSTFNTEWNAETPTVEDISPSYHYVLEYDTESLGDISAVGMLVTLSQSSYDSETGEYSIVNNTDSPIPSVILKNFGLSDSPEGIASDLLISEKLVIIPENIKDKVPLSKIDTDIYKLNPLDRPNYLGSMAGIFKSWGCIGDSLTEGGVDYNYENDTALTGYHGAVIEGISYPSYFARALNVDVSNYGKGGDCVKPGLSNSWITYANGTDIWTSPKDAYIIALGTNDRPWDGNPETDIDLTDYNNNAVTSVGGYAQIIQKILEIQPKAKIFLVTHPHTRGDLTAEVRGNINSDIRAMAEMFGCYVIDLEKYGIQPDEVAEWKKIYYNSAHLNALGYKWLADTYIAMIDWIIYHNIEDFRDTQFIGTDYEYRY